MNLKNLIITMLLSWLTGIGYAQELITIKGVVYNTDSTVLQGAIISIKEAGQSTQADRNGTFSIRVPFQNNFTVVCTHSGYETVIKQVAPGNNNTIDLPILMERKSVALEEIIVTAEKRESRLQRTPIAVSVISSENIQQRKNVEMSDLHMAVPNLVIMSTGAPTLNMMSVRGILTFSTDPTIGVYIDGIPMFDGYAASTQLHDIDRIEVLRGPQSTLYGRNALGGVINIHTKQPGNVFKGFAEAGLGNYNMQEYSAGISAPLIKDKLFIAANGFYKQRKGLYKNEFDSSDFDDTKSYGGNILLRYLASSRLSFVLSSKLEKNDIKGTFPYAIAKAAVEQPYVINQNGKNFENRTLSITTLQTKYQLGNWELSSTTGLTGLKDIYRDYDFDFSPYDVIVWSSPVRPQNTWTQEFKAISKKLGRWDITGGVFAFIDRRKSLNSYDYRPAAAAFDPNAPYTLSTKSDLKEKGAAFYTHITYAVTEKLKLTGGLRFDYDEKTFTKHDEFEKKPMEVQILPQKNLSTTGTAISPKINIAYLPTEDITLYANYARGFRPGGISLYSTASDDSLAYKPEYTDNYELGIKTEWLQNRLRANVTAFYTYWKDQQQTLVPNYQIANIGEMQARGLEFEVTALPVKNIETGCNIGIINTKYDKLLLADEAGTANKDYPGNSQVFTPEFSATLFVKYSGNLSKKISLYVVPEWKYIGRQYMNYYNDLVQEPFHLLHLNAGIRYKKYELKFWAKNVTGSRYISFAYASYRADAVRGILGLPATLGASVKINF